MIIRENLKNGIPEYDHTNGYVSYELGEWLYDSRFNLPCETYYHNVSEYEGWPVDSPEYNEWLGREDNWEMAVHNYFINYPDGFIVRHRFARPSYIQVLEWLEMEYDMKLNMDTKAIKVEHLRIPMKENGSIEESFTYKFNQSLSYMDLAKTTVNIILDRIRLAGYQIPE